ncbi:hypothetical protein BDQ17DRAFT_1170604, partial [Cyathus striatus]
AQLIELFVECILYGVYLSTLVLCLKVFLWKSKRSNLQPKNWLMLIATLMIFLISTLNISLGLVRSLNPRWSYNCRLCLGKYINDSEKLFPVITKDIYYQTYRCFIVYGRSWLVIIAPLFLWTSTIILTAISNAAPEIFSHSPHLFSFTYIWMGALISSAILNIYTTFMIAYRIWAVDRNAKSVAGDDNHPSQLQRITRIIIESAILYTMTTLIDIVCLATGTNFSHVTS